MSFKDRKLIQESFQEKLDTGIDKVKEFATRNPGLTAAGAGIGLGALTNYLTGGAEHLAGERAQDAADNVREARLDAVQDRLVPQSQFNAFTDNVKDAYDIGETIKPDLLSFLPGVDSDASALEKANSILKTANATTDHKFDMGDKGVGMSIDGYKYDPSISDDANYTMYKQHASSNPLSPEQEKAVNNAGARAAQDSARGVANATRDSYLQKMGLGGALGAGGAFAARKLKNK
jgi:hypothetical protein